VMAAAKLITADSGFAGFSTSALALDLPPAAALLPDVAGLILIPLGVEGDYFAWFRREISSSVDWLGDQTASNRLTPLSPRNSFSSWTQSVTGQATPWEGLDLEAAELCRDLEGVLLRRAESKLASLALHDALTGLPNRRLLMDRLDHALTKYARGEELALLFIDLDGFKAVNDSSGHDVGDALLVHTAKQILATTRAQDTVARLGGDEFVVLCENTTAEEADLVASRIVDAIRQPAFAGGHVVSITASVGITAANLSFSAQDLLREADGAMYRAKAHGRDQTSR
jgi:chemotaxis family two-component system sensor kinase Cph1